MMTTSQMLAVLNTSTLQISTARATSARYSSGIAVADTGISDVRDRGCYSASRASGSNRYQSTASESI